MQTTCITTRRGIRRHMRTNTFLPCFIVSLFLCGASSLPLHGDFKAEDRDNNPSASPIETPDIHAACIAAGGIHSLALKKDGTLLAWGSNEYGLPRTGNYGEDADSNLPVRTHLAVN